MKNIALMILVVFAGSAIWLTLPRFGSSREIVPTKSSLPNQSKFALLVGINDYESDKISDLSGPENDVSLMKSALTEYGFKENTVNKEISPVKDLLSRKATRKAILDGFEKHLIANAKQYKEQNNLPPNKGAVVVFYYSGHGSTLLDSEPRRDEPDGIDETIVPADSDLQGAKDIIDDEFDTLYEKLREYTSNITFIFDSCHSGTVTRGTARRVERYFPALTDRKGDSTNLSDTMNRNENYVTISGCLPNELSRERSFVHPQTKEIKTFGVMTYHLVQQLRQNPGATYRETMNGVQRAVVNLRLSQTPQVEGAIDRVVFGSTSANRKIPIFVKEYKLVQRKTEDGKEIQVNQISMEVGTLVGARAGGLIAVYSAKARELTGDTDKIGSGTIITADEFGSTAEVALTDKTMKTIPLDSKVLLVTPGFTDAKRRIALDVTTRAKMQNSGNTVSDKGIEIIKNLAANLKNNQYVETVEVDNLLERLNRTANQNAGNTANDNWDVAIIRATYKDFRFGNPQPAGKDVQTPPDNEDGYYLGDRNGIPLYNFWVSIGGADGAKVAGSMQTALESHVQLDSLRNLNNAVSPLKDKIQVKLIRVQNFSVNNAERRCEVVPVSEQVQGEDKLKMPRFQAGNKFYLEIANLSDRDMYIYLYSLGTSGKIALLHPPRGTDEPLKPGMSFPTYGTNKCRVYEILSPDKAPLGTETLKLIATSARFPAEMLAQPEIAKGVRDPSPFINLLKKVSLNQRDIGVSEISFNEWITKDVVIEIAQ